ncbi:MAG: methyltransferase domain-containing protein [Ardenticatenaceae bacterium]|nr:methyltransferase domain-containing protein [Ardenticatenaceae bacterium]
MNLKEIVKKGYDAVSYAYRADTEGEDSQKYHQWLDELVPLLSPGIRVLELGCGCGIPVARRLSDAFQVTGVDLSPVQIRRARQLVPGAHFLVADMTNLEFPTAHFDAVVSFYAIIHLPLEEQPELFRKMGRWLTPGGYLMITVGHTAWTGTEKEWLGVQGATMVWSHADDKTYERWLQESGFTIHWTRFIPEGDGGHVLILAQRERGQCD